MQYVCIYIYIYLRKNSVVNAASFFIFAHHYQNNPIYCIPFVLRVVRRAGREEIGMRVLTGV